MVVGTRQQSITVINSQLHYEQDKAKRLTLKPPLPLHMQIVKQSKQKSHRFEVQEAAALGCKMTIFIYIFVIILLV